MLLSSRLGHFIVVERRWYDSVGIAKARGDRKAWWIAAESDDHGAMQAMAGLSGNYIKMRVNHTHEENGEVTNVRS